MAPADNTRHLVAAAQRRRTDTLDRARKTLQELGETGQRHTVTAIAARAGVSRGWLYAQAELRDDIRRLTTAATAPAPAADRIERGTEASLRPRLTLAHQRIRELDTENRQFRDHVAQLHGQLRAARIGNIHVADTVNDATPQLTRPNARTGPR
ncbi:MAG: DUF6262 family protein [Mycobacterium sp.]